MSTESDVTEVKIQYLQKSLDKATSDMEKLKSSIQAFEMTTTTAITTLQVKLTLYATLVAFVVSVAIRYFT